ncbi:MAG TPA: cyclic pyranopterin monophosphate synthase MoaC [Bellilinea sp.]
MEKPQLSHIDESGKTHMVNVSAKPDTERTAVARGEVILKPDTVALIKAGLTKKGDVLTVAQLAGIMGAKKTAELIPLCHPIPIHQIAVELELDERLPGVVITSRLVTTGKTGIEMEALTAVAIAALTVYDMIKAVEKTARITNIRLIEKRGGQSGDVVNE